jgi:hypothetical protein
VAKPTHRSIWDPQNVIGLFGEGPAPALSMAFTRAYDTAKIFDFVLSPLETVPIIKSMESKINTEVAIISRIAELSYDHDLTDWNIADKIEAEFGVKVTAEYVAQVIADFVADMYDEGMSDEGYDPYMNTYTDDC